MNKKNKDRKQLTSCGGIPWRLHNGKIHILLVKQFANKERWGMPKGHMNAGENYEQCAIREIKEETGIDVELCCRLPDVVTAYKNEDKTVVSWLAQQTCENEPRHDDPESEVADARWFCINELPDIHVYQKPVIDAAIEMLNKLINVRDAISQST